MLKKIIMGFAAISIMVLAHNEDKCPVCSKSQWEFRGQEHTDQSKQEFWRTEETVCEKQCIDKLKKLSSPRLSEENGEEQSKLGLPVIKKVTSTLKKRLSLRR